ncbi:hypothetical protein GIB67_021393 [Kingdonia uniflora]|uniref:Uncharacterized protein n=1 Tax=Kingdonia uniflora TaxID=39325 RepID=A0A7J7MCV1_9MAGN|nr:hypothetical protein GIB67_021393 [Kingdonia uniflora]
MLRTAGTGKKSECLRSFLREEQEKDECRGLNCSYRILEMASKALFDRMRVAGHGLVRQMSTTSTTMDPSLHGRLRPLMHLMRYLRPHAAPLFHKPLLAATNIALSGNCS